MTDDHKNTKKEGYKRVLIYCSSKDQLDETISSLPIIDGYWDAFDNLLKAIDAIKKAITESYSASQHSRIRQTEIWYSLPMQKLHIFNHSIRQGLPAMMSWRVCGTWKTATISDIPEKNRMQ